MVQVWVFIVLGWEKNRWMWGTWPHVLPELFFRRHESTILYVVRYLMLSAMVMFDLTFWHLQYKRPFNQSEDLNFGRSLYKRSTSILGWSVVVCDRHCSRTLVTSSRWGPPRYFELMWLSIWTSIHGCDEVIRTVGLRICHMADEPQFILHVADELKFRNL